MGTYVDLTTRSSLTTSQGFRTQLREITQPSVSYFILYRSWQKKLTWRTRFKCWKYPQYVLKNVLKMLPTSTVPLRVWTSPSTFVTKVIRPQFPIIIWGSALKNMTPLKVKKKKSFDNTTNRKSTEQVHSRFGCSSQQVFRIHQGIQFSGDWYSARIWHSKFMVLGTCFRGYRFGFGNFVVSAHEIVFRDNCVADHLLMFSCSITSDYLHMVFW